MILNNDMRDINMPIQKEPMVSVVMITYGHEKYIEEAINGVFVQQTNFPVELIIANDCSPDNTDEVVNSLLSKVPLNVYVRYIRHENNLGMMANFIWALKQTKGKYIALCEGDDYWTDPLKLQKQVDFLEENQEYVACQHNREILDEKGVKTVEKSGAYVFTQCLLFRNKLNDHFYNNVTDVFNADTFLEFYLKLQGKYKHLDFVGAVYRYNGRGVYSSISVNLQKDHNIRTFKKILSLRKFYADSKYNATFDSASNLLLELQFLKAYGNKKDFKQFLSFLYSVAKYEKYVEAIQYKRILYYLFK